MLGHRRNHESAAHAVGDDTPTARETYSAPFQTVSPMEPPNNEKMV